MGFSCFQLNIFASQDQQSKINRQLMSISDQRQMLAGQMSHLRQVNKDNWTDEDVVLEIKQLELADNDLDMQQQTLETKLRALQSQTEQDEKAKQNNIKNGIAKLS